MSKKSYNKTSPIGGNRGCLCKNGKYSKRCCKGENIQQGVGSLVNQSNASETSNIITRSSVKISTDIQL
jgi:hypothetical protein